MEDGSKIEVDWERFERFLDLLERDPRVLPRLRALFERGSIFEKGEPDVPPTE